MAQRKTTRKPKLTPKKPPGFLTSANPESSRVDQRHRLGSEQWIDSGRWVNVKSSNVGSIRYEKDISALVVQFLDGAIYRYEQVPHKVAQDMFNTSSMGRFVWQRLRDVYPFIVLQKSNSGSRIKRYKRKS